MTAPSYGTTRVGWCIRLAGGAALLAVTGCVTSVAGDGESAVENGPQVTEVTPTSGAYGETITVRGTHLAGCGVSAASPGGERIQLLAETKPDPKQERGASSRDAGAPPVDQPLSFEFVFPADGEMTLECDGQELPFGSFEPTWKPSVPAELSGGRVFGAAVLGDEAAVLVTRADHAGFLVVGDEASRFVPIEPALGTPMSAAVRASGASVEALITTDDETVRVVLDGTQAVATPYELEAGTTIVGAGVDEEGLVAVATDASGDVVRLRGQPPSFTATGDPVPIPGSADRRAMAVAGDGTMVVLMSGSASSTFDDTATFSMAGLSPSDTMFSTARHIATLDDTVQRIEAESSGGIVTLSYCATDTGWFSSPETHCGSTKTIDGEGDLSNVSNGASPEAIGFGATPTVALCDGRRSLVQPLAGGEREPALYPCGSGDVLAIAQSEAGDDARLVVRDLDEIRVARRR